MTAEIRLRERQSAIARGRETGGEASDLGGGNDDGRVADKWQLLRALSEARERFGLSDRTISVLEALLSFQPGKAIDGAQPIIVFPSNRELSLRTRGMAPATLRRHIAALIRAELLLRRDSPNGKRYRRRGIGNGMGIDGDGEGGEEAFGFDLSPLAFRAGAIFEAAEEARREARLAQRLRVALSLHRRDIRKVIEAALLEERRGDWMGFAGEVAALTLQRTARASLPELQSLESALVRLRARVESAYLDAMTEQELSANDDRSERHYQNSKPDYPLDSKPGAKTEGTAERGWTEGSRAEPLAEAPLPGPADGPVDGVDRPEADGRAPEVRGMSFDLATVLRLCPDIASYALQPLRDWRAFVTVAHLVRGFLGISPDAWHRACAAMGEIQAATVIAAMLQRSDRITSPGGYLRSLTARAAKGQFRVEPMLRALA